MPGCLPFSFRRRRIFCRFRYSKDESFAMLVQGRCFDQIHSRLEHEPFEENKEWLHEAEYPLHQILAHQPPVSLVEIILRYHTESHVPEETLDVDGRTPLHVAAAHNCAVDVIERLLSGVSLVVPAFTKDSLDRYPLHWACCYPSLQDRSDRKFETILILLNANPQSVNVIDAHGKTPLDYARSGNLDERIADILTRAAAKLKEQHKNAAKQNVPKSTIDPPELKREACDPSRIPFDTIPMPASPTPYYFTKQFFGTDKIAIDADEVSSLSLTSSFTPSFTQSPSRGSVALQRSHSRPLAENAKLPCKNLTSQPSQISNAKNNHIQQNSTIRNQRRKPLMAQSIIRGQLKRMSPRRRRITDFS